jgi:lysine-N-methylase
MADYVAIVENGLARKALADLQPDHAAQARFFARLWQCRAMEKWSVAEKAIFDAVAQGLGVEDETGQVPVQQLIENYGRGIWRLHQALEAAPQLLEHYFLNEVFRTLFPLNASSPYEHYLRLVSRLGLLRLMLAAQCNASATLPDAITLAKTVQVYCKRFQHDAEFEQRVRQALSDSGWDRLEKLYRLLRA